jgi:DNA-directed RNA polymerase specialized sigma24 family protein
MRRMATKRTLVEANSPGSIDEADRQRSALMVAAQVGDRAAYETLLRGCVPLIKGVAYRQGVPPDGIDDVVQETLLTVHRARQTYDPNRPFSAWLRTIAQRRAIDAIRRRGYKRGSFTRHSHMRTIPIPMTIPNRRSTERAGPPDLVALSIPCPPGSAMR